MSDSVKSMALLPYADGGARLTLDGQAFYLDNNQTNALLSGLLSVATIKIEPNDE